MSLIEPDSTIIVSHYNEKSCQLKRYFVDHEISRLMAIPQKAKNICESASYMSKVTLAWQSQQAKQARQGARSETATSKKFASRMNTPQFHAQQNGDHREESCNEKTRPG
ncbi:MAG TPA: hypothetical protein VIM59_07500 [Cellvibrio sp.]